MSLTFADDEINAGIAAGSESVQNVVTGSLRRLVLNAKVLQADYCSLCMAPESLTCCNEGARKAADHNSSNRTSREGGSP